MAERMVRSGEMASQRKRSKTNEANE
jgi:hypothetical protein